MLNSDKISMGRVRHAYGLNGHEIGRVILALWPGHIFPVELWRKAQETYWRGIADSNQAMHKIEMPSLPEVDLSAKYFHAHLCALDIMSFFRKLSLHTQTSALREGLHFILEESYEDIDAVFPEERKFLFNTLSRLDAVDVCDQYSPDLDLFEEKILALPNSSYHFINHIFLDTIFVDKIAVIRLLRNYPLLREVKGITSALVKSILDSAQDADIWASQPQAITPSSTGSRKDSARIKATRQACEDSIEELLHEKHIFENEKNSWKPNLIFTVVVQT